jgi:hypothetical protein
MILSVIITKVNNLDINYRGYMVSSIKIANI